jgi:hypothetical protein
LVEEVTRWVGAANREVVGEDLVAQVANLVVVEVCFP